MDQYLRPNVLKITGAWPLPHDHVKERLKRFNCLTNNIIQIFGAVSLAYEFVYNMSDIYLACKGLTGALVLIQDILKNFSFMVRRDFLRQILLSLDDLYEYTPLPNTDKRITEKREEYKSLAHYWIIAIICSLGPALLILLGYPWCLYFINNQTDLLILTVFNESVKPIGEFILLYLIDVAVGYNIVSIQIATASLFSSCLLCVCSCVDALRYSLETATLEAIEQQRVTLLFGKCIVYHNKLLRLIKNIEKLFSPLLLTQFFVSSTCICVVSILLTQTRLDPGIQFIFITYLVGINIEMFLFCYFGQLLQTKFEMLNMAVFHYPWYEAPLTYQKNICFYLLCNSRPVVLTAGKLKRINLDYYYSLCKLSISYYTLLRSVVGDKDQ